MLEKDTKVLKFNIGSRKGFSINNTILEKCLLYDMSMQLRLLIVYVVIDLEVCYDRQLTSIESLVLELIGVDRKVLQVFAQVLLLLQYFICTGSSISLLLYRSKEDQYGGTRQKNLFTEEAYKVKSCLIIFKLEIIKQGVLLRVPISIIMYIVHSFID